MSEQGDPQAFGDVPLYKPTPAVPTTTAATATALAEPPAPESIDPPLPGTKFQEVLVASCFVLSSLGVVAFTVFYWINTAATDNVVNALLGVTLAIAFGGVGFGAILWAKLLMPHEIAVGEREPFGSPPEEGEAAGEVWNAAVTATGITKRPILRRTFLLGTGTLALPAVVLLRSLNDRPHGELAHTDWVAGSRMVDQFNNPIRLGDIAVNGIATVFPTNHTDPDSAAFDAVLVIRLPLNEVTPAIAAKSYQGHIAFSKICTHAGCPASLYDQQTHTLLCPCHQSQFKILEAAKPVAGPATRPLPQLAIGVDSENYLIATAPFNQPVGPGFWERK